MKPNTRTIALVVTSILTAIFAIQTFTDISILPVEYAAQFLGFPQHPLYIFLSMFIAFAIMVVYDLVFQITHVKYEDKRRVKNLLSFLKAFLSVWVTFASYGILSLIGIFPKQVDAKQLLNLYILLCMCFKLIGALTYRVLKVNDLHITYSMGGASHKWPE